MVKRIAFLVFILANVLIVGCASAQILTLSAIPQRSDCAGLNIYSCRALDSVEASGYGMARTGKMTWLSMVDRFYKERDRLFPRMHDSNETAEVRSYQRVLAERIDAGKITEAEWVFLLNKQQSVLAARDAQVQSYRNDDYSQQQQIQLQQQQMQMQQQQQFQQQQMQQQQFQQQQMQRPAPSYNCNRIGGNFVCNPY